jgi:GTP cyclohydrolase IA
LAVQIKDRYQEDVCNAFKILLHSRNVAGQIGCEETPDRAANAWFEKTSGYEVSITELFKKFIVPSDSVKGMVVIRDIEIESICEHHLERIWGYAHIGYIPDGHVLGLSKFHRIVDAFARRLNVQEMLTAVIADSIMAHLAPQGVGVVVEARHACMESRGIRRRGSVTLTSELRGCMFDDSTSRAEFLSLAKTERTM